MKNALTLVFVLALATAMLSVAWAEEAHEPARNEVPPSSAENLARTPGSQPESFTLCLQSAPGCSPGHAICEGKGVNTPCGVDARCAATCFVDFDSAVCKCRPINEPAADAPEVSPLASDLDAATCPAPAAID